MSPPIHVFEPREGETHISVRDWPDARAPWRVRSADKRGRELEIAGYSNFKDQLVGRLTLHVDGRKPLMITRYSFEEHLITFARPEVLGQLVLCAQAIATRLHEDLKVGNGSLMWEMEGRQLAEISKRFPQFGVLPRRKRFRRGKRYLVWRP
ncbi:MAG TPA: hypothetical protein VGX16_06695 [Solirubrobacteraceae bacterium]|nr:hypothetical protein [Solirubrobacteraceae bacterium]